MLCEMCGKLLEAHEIYRVRVEGSILSLCHSCASCGTILSHPSPPRKKHKEKPRASTVVSEETHVVSSKRKDADESEERIIPDFGKRVHLARERKGLTQHDAALHLNEKESILKKVEAGELTPDFKLAKKLERFFNITLIEEITIDLHATVTSSSQEELTLGDVVKIRRRTPK